MAITNGGQFSFRPSPGLAEGINEFVQFHQDQTGVPLKTDREIFETIFEVAQAKYDPYIDNNKKAEEAEKTAEKYKIENEELKQLEKEMQVHINELNTQLSERATKVNNLSSKIDDILIRISDINPVLK